MSTQHTVNRVNPRRPIHYTPDGVARIILGEVADGSQVQMRHAGHAAAEKSVRAEGGFEQAILVATIPQKGYCTDHAREVIAAASILANAKTEVVLLLLGQSQDDFAEMGVDRVVFFPQFDSTAWQPEAMAEAINAWRQKLTPVRVLMADDDIDGDLARRVAAKSRTALQTGVVQVRPDKVMQRAGCHFDRHSAPQEFMLLNRFTAETNLPYKGLGKTETESQTFQAASSPGVKDLGVVQGEAQSVALEEADFILSAGKGMTNKPLFYELASQLGAATGASRVAVDDGHFTRDRQVGATGKTVQSSVYIAVGISGAVQHLQGIKDCRYVIAVNTDESAPMVKRAQLSVIHDANEWMQAMSELVASEKE